MLNAYKTLSMRTIANRSSCGGDGQSQHNLRRILLKCSSLVERCSCLWLLRTQGINGALVIHQKRTVSLGWDLTTYCGMDSPDSSTQRNVQQLHKVPGRYFKCLAGRPRMSRASEFIGRIDILRRISDNFKSKSFLIGGRKWRKNP